MNKKGLLIELVILIKDKKKTLITSKKMILIKLFKKLVKRKKFDQKKNVIPNGMERYMNFSFRKEIILY